MIFCLIYHSFKDLNFILGLTSPLKDSFKTLANFQKTSTASKNYPKIFVTLNYFKHSSHHPKPFSSIDIFLNMIFYSNTLAKNLFLAVFFIFECRNFFSNIGAFYARPNNHGGLHNSNLCNNITKCDELTKIKRPYLQGRLISAQHLIFHRNIVDYYRK